VDAKIFAKGLLSVAWISRWDAKYKRIKENP